jgi:hypothetical protein
MAERRNLLLVVDCSYSLFLWFVTPCSFTSSYQRFNEHSASLFKVAVSTYQYVDVAPEDRNV